MNKNLITVFIGLLYCVTTASAMEEKLIIFENDLLSREQELGKLIKKLSDSTTVLCKSIDNPSNFSQDPKVVPEPAQEVATIIARAIKLNYQKNNDYKKLFIFSVIKVISALLGKSISHYPHYPEDDKSIANEFNIDQTPFTYFFSIKEMLEEWFSQPPSSIPVIKEKELKTLKDECESLSEALYCAYRSLDNYQRTNAASFYGTKDEQTYTRYQTLLKHMSASEAYIQSCLELINKLVASLKKQE